MKSHPGKIGARGAVGPCLFILLAVWLFLPEEISASSNPHHGPAPSVRSVENRSAPAERLGEIENAAASAGLQAEKKAAKPDMQKRKLYWVLGILGATVLAGLLVRFKFSRKFRVLFLLGAVVIIGFLKGGCPCMISSFTETVLGAFGAGKPWVNYLWFLGLIPVTYVFGRVWCGWVCHLGALQEFLFLGSKFQALKSRLAGDVMKGFQYLLLGGLVLQLFITKTNIWCQIDPFLVAFNLYSATTVGLVLVVLMLVSSAFIFRPFCRAACPIGLLLGWVSRIPGASILEDKTDCITCSICSETCHSQAIERKKDGERLSLLFDNRECNSCGECIGLCDKDAIKFARTKIRQAKSPEPPGKSDTA